MTAAPEVSEEDWEEACRREDEFRRLVAQARSGVIGRAAVQQAAAKLEISVTHLYRLIRLFREDRRVSVLLPLVRGSQPPAEGQNSSLILVRPKGPTPVWVNVQRRLTDDRAHARQAKDLACQA